MWRFKTNSSVDTRLKSIELWPGRILVTLNSIINIIVIVNIRTLVNNVSIWYSKINSELLCILKCLMFNKV